MSAKLPLVAACLAVCLGHGTPCAAAEPTPEASVAATIAALRGNDVASLFTALPTARQLELADGWKAMTAGLAPQPGQDAGQGQGQGRRGGRNPLGMMLDRPLQSLQTADGAAGVARQLAGILGQFAVVTQPATATAPAMPALPDDQQWLGFMQRGMAQGGLNAAVDGVLASGLETRQLAVLQGLFDAYAAWAATGLDDASKQTAAGEQLMALAKAMQLTSAADLATVELPELLNRANAALPSLKGALLAFGLDADAVLASATVTAETATADSAVVVLQFTAFAKPHALPLKLTKSAQGWSITADSPALRWLRNGGMMRGPGGFGGGRQRGQGQGQGQGQGGAPAPAPAPAGQSNF